MLVLIYNYNDYFMGNIEVTHSVMRRTAITLLSRLLYRPTVTILWSIAYFIRHFQTYYNLFTTSLRVQCHKIVAVVIMSSLES